MLAIEVDGTSHDFENNDVARQDRLESLGVRFLRFDDKEIITGMPTALNFVHTFMKGLLDNSTM